MDRWSLGEYIVEVKHHFSWSIISVVNLFSIIWSFIGCQKTFFLNYWKQKRPSRNYQPINKNFCCRLCWLETLVSLTDLALSVHVLSTLTNLALSVLKMVVKKWLKNIFMKAISGLTMFWRLWETCDWAFYEKDHNVCC